MGNAQPHILKQILRRLVASGAALQEGRKCGTEAYIRLIKRSAGVAARQRARRPRPRDRDQPFRIVCLTHHVFNPGSGPFYTKMPVGPFLRRAGRGKGLSGEEIFLERGWLSEEAIAIGEAARGLLPGQFPMRRCLQLDAHAQFEAARRAVKIAPPYTADRLVICLVEQILHLQVKLQLAVDFVADRAA